MTIRKIEANGREYQFVNSSRNTRSGFAHDTTLFKDGYVIGNATAIYYNRTWECYQYQSVMLRCINAIIDRKLEDYIDRYKSKNNIKRLTAEKREAVTENFYQQDEIKELEEVKEQLKSRN